MEKFTLNLFCRFISIIIVIATFGFTKIFSQDERKRYEEIRPDEMLDLVILSLNPSQRFPQPGERIAVEVNLGNRSMFSAEDVTLVLYEGRNQVATEMTDLPSNETVTVKLLWIAPSTESYITLTAVLDSDSRFIEMDKSDNYRSEDIIVIRKPPPETEFELVSLDLQTTDSTFIMHGAIRNNSTVSLRTAIVFYSAEKITELKLSDPILPYSTLNIEIPWRESNISVFSAELNPRYRHEDKNPENNYLLKDLRPAVDLKIDDLSIHALKYFRNVERQVTLNFKIVNCGKGAILTPFVNRVSAGITNANNFFTFDIHTKKLDMNESVYVSKTISIPANVNNFDIQVEVDATNIIYEYDENNNSSVYHYQNPTPNIGRWVSIGPTRITDSKRHGNPWMDAVGRLCNIAIHPKTPSTIYVGGPRCGAWKTTNGGVSWIPISDAATLNVASIAIDPVNPKLIYLATEHDGIFLSDDEGISWKKICSKNLSAGGRFFINPNNTNIFYLNSKNGVYKSTDAGVTWTLSLPAGPGGEVRSIVMDQVAPDYLHAVIFSENNSSIAGIYKTFDGGTNWSIENGCSGGKLPTDDSNTEIQLAISGSKLFASYVKGSVLTLFSTSGHSFATCNGKPEHIWQTLWVFDRAKQYSADPYSAYIGWQLSANPRNPQYLYLSGVTIFRSTNGGKTFEVSSGWSICTAPDYSAHVDQKCLAFDPFQSNIVYALNDGGIYRSLNYGKGGTWQFIGEGITNVEFYDHAVAKTNPDIIIGGTQDNGTIKYDGKSTFWKMIYGGDGATVDIDPKNENVLYGMHQFIGDYFFRSDDGGKSSHYNGKGLPQQKDGCLEQNAHFQVHPSNPSIMLASPKHCGPLYSVTNPSPQSSWQPIFTPPKSYVVRSAIDPSIDLYYACTNKGEIYAGKSGKDLKLMFEHQNASYIHDIDVDLDNPSSIYVCFGKNAGDKRIYRITRNVEKPDKNSVKSEDITFNLATGIYPLTLAIDRMKLLVIYVGSDKGVYRGSGKIKNNKLSWHWEAYNNGLPLAPVKDLECHPTSGILRVATHGRGAFEVLTDYPIGSQLSVGGNVTSIDIRDIGTGYGPPSDFMDVDVIINLDSRPYMAFGFQLRNDANLNTHTVMLDLLKKAYINNWQVAIDFTRSGLHTGQIFAVRKAL